MKKKILIIIVIALICVLGIFIYTHTETVEEYIPESEIENVDLRKTIVNLYFQNKETKELVIETRLIDSKDLLKNPYNTLINMLIEGAEYENNESIIPKETKVLGTELKGNCLNVNLSKEFVMEENKSVEEKYNSLYQIINTVLELNEVSSVKFFIEGEESNIYKESGINLTEEFVKRN